MVSNKADTIEPKALVAINMVGVDVGVDDIADGNPCFLSDGVPKFSPLIRAPATINHGDTMLADNETNIGDFTPIFCIGNFMNALMDKDTGSDFLEGQSFGPEGKSQS